MCALSNPHLSFADGFGTLNKQVAGFHRAVPSTTLDKANMQFFCILLYFVEKSSVFPEKVHIFLMDKCAKYWYHISKGVDPHAKTL